MTGRYGFRALPSAGRGWIVRGPLGVLLSRHEIEDEARAEVARLDVDARIERAVIELSEALREIPTLDRTTLDYDTSEDARAVAARDASQDETRRLTMGRETRVHSIVGLRSGLRSGATGDCDRVQPSARPRSRLGFLGLRDVSGHRYSLPARVPQ